MKWTTFSEARLTNAQDGVLARYKNRFGLTNKETQALHMFFSPCRVLKGLTKEEVRLVIKLYPLLGSYRRSVINDARRFLDANGVPTIQTRIAETELPEELTQYRRVTRRDFREGIRKLLHILSR